MQNSSTYARPIPRPPSPTLEAQRLIREQQDDEYLASLQADREKAKARRLEEEAARQAALEEERKKEEETRHKFEEEQELERRLAAKEASLPQEPASDDENAVNLLVLAIVLAKEVNAELHVPHGGDVFIIPSKTAFFILEGERHSQEIEGEFYN